MLVRTVVAAAMDAIFRRNSSDKKGKAMDPYRRDYGSATRPDRRASYSGSRSGEHLHSVPEDVNDSFSGYAGETSAWNNVEEDCSDECSEEDEENWEVSPYNYGRAIRLFAIVPIGSFVFFVFAALLPELIARKPLPSTPSFMHLVLSIILSASLWSLAHALRVPIHSVLSSLLTYLCTLIWAIFHSRARQTSQHLSARYIASLTSLIHVLALAFLQEALRIASFAMVNLHWHQAYGPPPAIRNPRARDAAFREVWALALGWALAEVCAGVMQGYEQLALYADIGLNEQSNSNSGDEDVVEGTGKAVIDEEAVGLVSRSMPCVDIADDDDVETAKLVTQSEIDLAVTRLVNMRAREELEELYGQPYIDIPVFIPLLQRLDSILLSLGVTLLLAAAYLPKPYSSSSLIASPLSSQNIQPTPHIHMLPIIPTFFTVAFLHAVLGALHAPPLLPCIGIPAAAYTSCIVGLALAFAGVGVWVGIW